MPLPILSASIDFIQVIQSLMSSREYAKQRSDSSKRNNSASRLGRRSSRSTSSRRSSRRARRSGTSARTLTFTRSSRSRALSRHRHSSRRAHHLRVARRVRTRADDLRSRHARHRLVSRRVPAEQQPVARHAHSDAADERIRAALCELVACDAQGAVDGGRGVLAAVGRGEGCDLGEGGRGVCGLLCAAAGGGGGGLCAAGAVLGLEVGDFGVAHAVGEGGVWVDFLLVLGNGARRGCWVVKGLLVGCFLAFVATVECLCFEDTYLLLRCPAGLGLAGS